MPGVLLIYYGKKETPYIKIKKYRMLNESCTISSAIYVSLLFLPHIILIVSLSLVKPNQCPGVFFIFRFFMCTFILFRFTHVITTEITSLISNLLTTRLQDRLKRRFKLLSQFCPLTTISSTTPGTHNPRINTQTVTHRLLEFGGKKPIYNVCLICGVSFLA